MASTSLSFPRDTRIDAERFWSTIERSAEIGAGREGGLSRLALTDADKQMRDVFVGWCREAGLAVTVDKVGNIFARRAGRENDLPPVASLANIAGITSPTRFLQTTLAEWNRVMSINATGTYIVTKRIAAGMVERGYGRIVNMSSVSAIRGGGVAKAAILGFTRAVARELGPSGVTVNSVTPGVVATDIRAGATNDELEAKLAADVPLGRQATAEDIANLFEFLMSDRSAYITGATYDINGGSHIS